MKEKYLTIEDVSKVTTLAKSTLYNYVYYQTIPFLRIGGRIVFEEKDLQNWIDKKKVKVIQRK
jgi:excisionase family DNA binding protein